MIFKQYTNGSCDIEFSKEEIEAITKTQTLHLSEEALRHFGNHLVKIVAEWQFNFSDEVKKIQSKENTEIKSDL